MARQPSLRSQLNQIRAWVRQGRTNAWIAHQLDTSVEQLERFKKEHELDGTEQGGGRAVDPLSIPVPIREVADEAEDEEAEEDEAAADEREERSSSQRSSVRRPRRSRTSGREQKRDERKPDRERKPQRDRPKRSGQAGRSEEKPEDERGKRRRGRRGGRRRRKIPTYEATFDHGQEGYGFWLDPAIAENTVYLEHWAGHRAIEVRFDSDSITIRKSEPGGSDED